MSWGQGEELLPAILAPSGTAAVRAAGFMACCRRPGAMLVSRDMLSLAFFQRTNFWLSGHSTSQPGLGMDQVFVLVTAPEVPKPRAEEGLLTAEAAWHAWVQHCCLILETASVLHSQVLPY